MILVTNRGSFLSDCLVNDVLQQAHSCLIPKYLSIHGSQKTCSFSHCTGLRTNERQIGHSNLPESWLSKNSSEGILVSEDDQAGTYFRKLELIL
jgi:hypothetical protein